VFVKISTFYVFILHVVVGYLKITKRQVFKK